MVCISVSLFDLGIPAKVWVPSEKCLIGQFDCTISLLDFRGLGYFFERSISNLVAKLSNTLIHSQVYMLSFLGVLNFLIGGLFFIELLIKSCTCVSTYTQIKFEVKFILFTCSAQLQLPM